MKPKRTDGELGLDEYQRQARATAGEGGPICWALGLAGETGEIVEQIKKAYYHGDTVVVSDIADELGDLLWYLAAMASAYDVSLSAVAERNLAKLKERYPDGFIKSRDRKRSALGRVEDPEPAPRLCAVEGCSLMVSEHWSDEGSWTPHEPREARA